MPTARRGHVQGESPLLLHHFRFFGFGQVVDFVLILLGQLLDLLFGLLAVVLGQIFLLPSSAALLPSRRTLRTETRASSPISLMRATSLRRTSVESGGTAIRITRPSFDGLKPKSLAGSPFRYL